MPGRDDAMMDFLRGCGWGDVDVSPIPGDASTRRYFRIRSQDKHAILMDQPQHTETPPAPPHASPEERRRMGYNAVARLAGADCFRFVSIANYLRGLGLSTPIIYADDCNSGFVLMEDLGDNLYADVIARGVNEREAYAAAIEALASLYAHPAPARLSGQIPLYDYDETALLAEISLLTEWYLPLVLGRKATTEEAAEHQGLWREVLSGIATDTPIVVHRDYHAQNLLWLPSRNGIAKVGMIDFQDAVAGSNAYDLASLLEDARRDVPLVLAEEMVSHYIAAMRRQGTPVDDESFRAAFAIMAAQRNTKIAGIFARLHLRDGKPRYLAYLPRVLGHLRRDLQHPMLAKVKRFYERLLPSAALEGHVNGAFIQ